MPVLPCVHGRDRERVRRSSRQSGAEVIQIAPNLLESARTFFRDAASPFPFVCDPDKRLYAVYGLGDLGALTATRTAL